MPNCRFCNFPLHLPFCDLGHSPLSNAYLTKDDLAKKESLYPLCAFVCEKCLLVQVEEFEKPENIFKDYAYFSSYSQSWLKHCELYTEMATQRFKIDQNSQVVEIASNDGYLLQYFQNKKIPVLGIEPAANVAKVAQEKGIPTVVDFFGTKLAQKSPKSADLIIGNNVLAHVPNLNNFVEGLSILLKDEGLITIEFPHLLQLMEHTQFDTIYHEHFSYFSFLVVEKIFANYGMKIFDVEEIATHGGSLRIFAAHHNSNHRICPNIQTLKDKEAKYKLDHLATYLDFDQKVQKVKEGLLTFLTNAKKEGKKVVAYGAAAKGNTLLNYCGIKNDFIDYCVDLNPHKQGKFLPGTHIPIKSPNEVFKTKPNYLLILPWNLKFEIMQQMSPIKKWGGQFVISVPKIEVFCDF